MKQLAGCALIDAQGRLLLLHRSTPELVQWELPGGKIEPDETPEAAAVRELKEELAVDVKVIEALGDDDFTYAGRTLHYYWFLAAIISGQPHPAEEKFDAVRYFELADLKHRTDLSANIQKLMSRFPGGFGPNFR